MHSADRATSRPRDPGYVINVAGAGVLASSKHQAEAQKFLAFLVSPAAQKIIAHDESYEYPLGSGVTSARGLVPVLDAAARPDHGQAARRRHAPDRAAARRQPALGVASMTARASRTPQPRSPPAAAQAC